MSNKADELQPIIVKKINKVEGGHHGGAWKVAYADFVTAMMAFFLLLWLLGSVTEEAKTEISSYFSPTPDQISSSLSGAGGVMGGLSMTREGAMAEMAQPIHAPKQTGAVQQGKKVTQRVGAKAAADLKTLEEELRKREESAFKESKEELEKALQENSEMAALSKNLKIDVTSEGLRIQIIDQDGDPMFASGSAEMREKMRGLLAMVAGTIEDMPNDISVRGHTDATAYGSEAKYTNWELSADRANASRAVLMDNNISEERVVDVMGKANRDPFIADNPHDAQNRRITILLLHENIEDALARGAFETIAEDIPGVEIDSYDPYADYDASLENGTSGTDGASSGTGESNQPYEKTPGAVYFP